MVWLWSLGVLTYRETWECGGPTCLSCTEDRASGSRFPRGRTADVLRLSTQLPLPFFHSDRARALHRSLLLQEGIPVLVEK